MMKLLQKNRLGRYLPALAVALMLGNVPLPAEAQGQVNVGISTKNKLEVELAVGPSEVDYSEFEGHLLQRLAAKDQPVMASDLIVRTGERLTDLTSEFDWWVYDHTKPTGAAGGITYNGVRTADDATHTYIENNSNGQSTSNSYGAINRSIGSITYTPDPDNPDIGKGWHPYNGITTHMIESDNGATMDFYGYPTHSYKDFRYLPNDQRTRKAFEFAIQEDLAYDALDGVGFFFNTDITGNYDNGTQLMSGYLLFLEYAGGSGAFMKIYKFKDVNTKVFHHTGAVISYGQIARDHTASFTLVSQSNIYKPDHKYRRIKIEVFPTYVSAWYNGSNDVRVLSTPIPAGEAGIPYLVNFSAATGAHGVAGNRITLDKNYIKSYGFGPMASYIGHGCARPTHLALQKLSLEMDRVRSLTEVLRDSKWENNTKKILVNLNDADIEDFEDESTIGELLNRLRNDDMYYIGWGSDGNKEASQAFLNKNDLKGLVISNGDAATDTYNEQMDAIANKIYERYWLDNNNNTVLVTDDVVMNAVNADITNTADPDWPNGKWKVVHRTDGISNPEGTHELSGQMLNDLDLQFNLPGQYDIYYTNQFVKTITAHREPVPGFSVSLAGSKPTFTDKSYDPDDLSAEGIVKTVWTHQKLSDPSPSAEMTLDELHAALPVLEEGVSYLIAVKVTDKNGVEKEYSQQVRYDPDAAEDPEKNEPPYGDFTIDVPGAILEGVGTPVIKLTNKSYDLHNLPITSTTITLKKDGVDYPGYTFREGDNDVSTLPAGSYTITLVASNGIHESVPVSKSFSVVNDDEDPTAAASSATADFTVSSQVALAFADEGGSGLKNQRAVVVTVAPGAAKPAAPAADDPAWTLTSPSPNRNVSINNAGDNYIFWEATDNAENTVTGGPFGPYKLTKQPANLTLTASPASEVTYPTPIELTATFPGGITPTGTVFFYLGDAYIGSAPVTDGNQATFNYNPAASTFPAADEAVTFRAEYGGNNNYNTSTDDLAYTINKLPAANVTVEIGQTGKEYNGQPVDLAPEVTVSEDIPYEVTYTGKGGNTYNSTTPPTDAGEYTVTVTTTHLGYETATASKDFTITPKPVTIQLSTDPENTAEKKDDVTLTATLTGLVNNPAGKIRFMDNGVQVGTDATIVHDGNGGYTASVTWPNVVDGNHSLTAEYIPDAGGDNYSFTASQTSEIPAYEVTKIHQTGFDFTEADDVIDDYGYEDKDTPFPVTAGGGETAGTVTYEVTEGKDVVEVDPTTGEVTIIGAGTAVITAKKPGDDDYSEATSTVTINIAKATPDPIVWPEVVPEVELTYGDPLNNVALTDNGNGGGDEAGSFDWTNGNDIPTVNNSGYEITFKPTPKDEKNYDYSDVELTKVLPKITVKPRPITVKADDVTVNYGQTPELTYTVTSGSLVGSDELGGTLQVDNLKPGTHTITQGTLADSNYAITFVEAVCTVSSSIIIGGQPVEPDPDDPEGNTFTIVDEDGDGQISLEDIYKAAGPNAEVVIEKDGEVLDNTNPQQPIDLDYGENNFKVAITVTVTTETGTETFTLVVEHYYDLIHYRYPDVPTISLNPATNGGYEFNETGFQWYREGEAIEGANKPYYRITDNATYYCALTMADGKAWRTIDITVEPRASTLKAYPNPTQGQVTLSADDEWVPTDKIQVFDLYGRLVLQPYANPFDMSSLPKGTYIIKVNGETVRVIVNK
jgi:hypothetical protein